MRMIELNYVLKCLMFMLMFMKILRIRKKNSRNPKVLKKPILYVADNLVTNKICTFHQIGELYVDAMLNLARQVY